MIDKDVDRLIDYSKWLTERYEVISDGFSSRAGILLGLMGVELAYVAGLNIEKGLRLAAAAAIIVSGLLFMGVLAPRKMKFPQEDDLRDVLFGKRESHFTVVEQVLGAIHAKNSVVYQYWIESKKRAFWFTSGISVFIAAQVLLAILIGKSK